MHFKKNKNASGIQIPFLGYIRAGFASPGEEELSETINLEQYLIQDKDSSYLLRVQGDSMQDAGILDGDYVPLTARQETLSWLL
jgi:SOS-response transcriptional repressor LexA